MSSYRTKAGHVGNGSEPCPTHLADRLAEESSPATINGISRPVLKHGRVPLCSEFQTSMSVVWRVYNKKKNAGVFLHTSQSLCLMTSPFSSHSHPLDKKVCMEVGCFAFLNDMEN